ncbi:hypothetical protein JB92DRAFT_2274838 [Gautieria morchelliformis]|nr:hypothetical protein JB92DRAFT_2274838 [Gautieria morchelliformis]
MTPQLPLLLQCSRSRTHVEVVRGLSHEGGQHAPLRHVSSFGGGRPQQQGACHGPTMTSDFEVNLEDRYKGAEINIGCPFRSFLRLSSPFLVILRLGIQFIINESSATTSAAQQPPPTRTPDVSHVLVLHTQYYTLNVSVGLAKGSEFVFEGEGNEIPDWETSLYCTESIEVGLVGT